MTGLECLRCSPPVHVEPGGMRAHMETHRAAALERVLFAGGPKHGQVLTLHGEPRHIKALESTGNPPELYPDWTLTEVTYQRTTMVLNVAGRRYARPLFVDTRVWAGGQDMDPTALAVCQDAVVRQWMAGGRDVTPEDPCSPS